MNNIYAAIISGIFFMNTVGTIKEFFFNYFFTYLNEHYFNHLYIYLSYPFYWNT